VWQTVVFHGLLIAREKMIGNHTLYTTSFKGTVFNINLHFLYVCESFFDYLVFAIYKFNFFMLRK
jgi:hypothetical protein